MTVRELIKSLKFVKKKIGNVEVFVAGCNHNGDFLKCPLSENGITCNADSITITAPHHNANTEKRARLKIGEQAAELNFAERRMKS